MNNPAHAEPHVRTDTATITVAFVNPAKGPKRSGSIKDTNNRLWSVWPNMLSQFDQGETYEIEFTTKVIDGVRYCNVSKARHITPHGHQPRDAAPQPQQQQRKPVQQEAQQNGNGWYRPTHPRDGERMFVCSVLNAFIQTGRIRDDVAALTKAVNDLRSVWQDTFGQDDQSAG